MALSIGVSTGSRIAIDKRVLSVKEITQGLIAVQLDGPNEPLHVVSEEERIMLMPEVFVFIGKPGAGAQAGSRLAFEAPRRIKINRIKDHARSV